MSISPASSVEDIPMHVVQVEGDLHIAHILVPDNTATSGLLSPGASPTVHCAGIVHNPDSTSPAACAVEIAPSGEQELQTELTVVVQKYREDMVELMSSLSGTDRSTLVMLDDEGFVNNLLEEIKSDCVQTFNKHMKCGKHLYTYFCQKGYSRIAEEWLRCMEDMEDM